MAEKKQSGQDVTIVDGSLDFAGGVNSYAVTTVQSPDNPNGLKRNQLAWMDNCTVRGGGVTQRPGWKKQGDFPVGATGLYQGKFMYEPDSEEPYLIVAVGGHIWKMNVDDPSSAVDLSDQFGITLPADLERYYFVQAEQFLIIQCGDLLNLPLFWDGTTLRKSLGLSGNGLIATDTNIGTFLFANTNTFVMPAVGATVAITASAMFTGAVGDIIFTLKSMTYDPATNQITGFSGIGTVWQVVAPTAPPTTNLTLLNLSTVATIGATNPIGQNFSHLNNPPAPFTLGTPEIPPATAMDYYMGRLWYAQGRQYSAGDIVGNQASGTQQYNFRDSVLKVTENPLAIGGDGFTVPTNAGNIRAIKHSANINTQLGQGQLFIFTRRSVYSLTVPVSRTDWIGADTNNQPLQSVVQVTNGAVNDRSVAAQNGDLFFQSFEPSIRSLITAVRNFQQWGNVPISINENRILAFNDRGLMQFSSGISFSNRMLQTVLPYLSPVGAAFRALIPLNFDVVSTLETQLPPVWEGMWEGLDILELSTGDFGGRPRAFAAVYSPMNRNIQLWEITDADRFENGDNRVIWYIETPAFTWNDEFMLKKMVSAELWIDRLYGEVMFSLDWRPDGDPCWYKWHEWKECTARDSCEDVHNPQCLYPTKYRESYRQTITLPNPPNVCERVMKRPANIGYQMQVRLTVKGFCRIRGILLKAETVKQQLFGTDMVC